MDRSGSDATVLIAGAGPAGLVPGSLLRAEGVDCLIVERRSREHVEKQARARFLATIAHVPDGTVAGRPCATGAPQERPRTLRAGGGP